VLAPVLVPPVLGVFGAGVELEEGYVRIRLVCFLGAFLCCHPPLRFLPKYSLFRGQMIGLALWVVFLYQ